MRRRTATLTAAAISCALVATPLGAPRAFEAGLFFDENAETCVASIENFGPAVSVHVFAFVAAGDTLNGAVLRLQLPPGFLLSNQDGPREGQNTIVGDISSTNGVDITLSPCVLSDGSPIELLSFDLNHHDITNPGAHVEDLVLKLRGGTNVADSLTLTEPHLKICPDDPIEGVARLVPAVATQATLNCTSECPCTVSVERKSWADFKRLYLEP